MVLFLFFAKSGYEKFVSRVDMLPVRFAACLEPILECASCTLIPDHVVQLSNYVKDNSSQDAEIYIGQYDHSQIYISDVSLYFLMDRRPLTRYYELHPGVQTTLSVQEVLVEDVVKTQPPFIILNSMPEESGEPNLSSVSSGVRLIDLHIAGNFRKALEFGPYDILVPTN